MRCLVIPALFIGLSAAPIVDVQGADQKRPTASRQSDSPQQSSSSVVPLKLSDPTLNSQPNPKPQSQQSEGPKRDGFDKISIGLNIVLVGATVWLAIFTGRLWSATNKLAEDGQRQIETAKEQTAMANRQLELTNKQFELSQKQFIAAHPPQLKISHFQGPTGEVTREATFPWSFRISNEGETSAYSLEMKVVSLWASRTEAIAAFKAARFDNIIGKGPVFNLDAGDSVEIQMEHKSPEPVQVGLESWLFIIGSISYLDASNLRRNRDFMLIPKPGNGWRDDSGQNRFVLTEFRQVAEDDSRAWG